MNTTFPKAIDGMLAEPMFKIGQDVHLKTGGPDMIVNQCNRDADGMFILDTIWFGAGRTEEHGTYPEALLQASSRSHRTKL
jgi:uncharacterized protein YodC (DUF2158 family)